MIVKKKKKKKKRTCQLVDFGVPVYHRVKIKENKQKKKKDNIFYLAAELKRLKNIKGMVIPIVVCAFRTIHYG